MTSVNISKLLVRLSHKGGIISTTRTPQNWPQACHKIKSQEIQYSCPKITKNLLEATRCIRDLFDQKTNPKNILQSCKEDVIIKKQYLWPIVRACVTLLSIFSTVPTSAKPYITPYEKYFGCKPSLKNLRTFGQPAVVQC